MKAPAAFEVRSMFGLSFPTTFCSNPRGGRAGFGMQRCGLPEHISLLLAEVQIFLLQLTRIY